MVNPRVTHRFWLLVPPLLLLGLDATLTLLGQPPAYWSEDWSRVRELNPAAAWLLGLHPILFIGSVLLIGTVIAGALLILPLHFARVLCLVATFFSAAGVSSWLVEYGIAGWVLVIALFWSAERMVTWAWRQSGR